MPLLVDALGFLLVCKLTEQMLFVKEFSRPFTKCAQLEILDLAGSLSENQLSPKYRNVENIFKKPRL